MRSMQQYEEKLQGMRAGLARRLKTRLEQVEETWSDVFLRGARAGAYTQNAVEQINACLLDPRGHSILRCVFVFSHLYSGILPLYSHLDTGYTKPG